MKQNKLRLDDVLKIDSSGNMDSEVYETQSEYVINIYLGTAATWLQNSPILKFITKRFPSRGVAVCLPHQ